LIKGLLVNQSLKMSVVSLHCQMNNSQPSTINWKT